MNCVVAVVEIVVHDIAFVVESVVGVDVAVGAVVAAGVAVVVVVVVDDGVVVVAVGTVAFDAVEFVVECEAVVARALVLIPFHAVHEAGRK